MQRGQAQPLGIEDATDLLPDNRSALIEYVVTEGRTLMFVSHAADTIEALCERAIWLHHGQMQLDGPASEVLERYNATLHQGG